ncbi:hypothetical protein [Cysteiniphilum sp. 6C5]
MKYTEHKKHKIKGVKLLLTAAVLSIVVFAVLFGWVRNQKVN